MGGRQVLAARRLLAGALDGELPEQELAAAARGVVAELGAVGRLLELIDELASGEGDPEGCARLSYRHVLGFDKLLLIDGGPRQMLRAHVWHPGAGTIGKEDIHNHRSPLASYVVRGRLAMELYEVDDRVGDLAAARYRGVAGRAVGGLDAEAGRSGAVAAHAYGAVRGGQFVRPARAHPAPGLVRHGRADGDAVPGDGRRTAAPHRCVHGRGPASGGGGEGATRVSDYLAELGALAEWLRAL